jgi:hypothetical protein
VTLPWPIAVRTEPRIITLRVERDARLAAGAGGIARSLADAAGMASEASSQLQAETAAACLQAFESLTSHPVVLQVRYEVYSDRLEIAFAAPGAPAAQSGRRLTRYFGQTIAST